MTDPSRGTPPKRSLVSLIASLPGLLIELIKAELEQLRNEVTGKLKRAGIGVGLFAAAAVVGVFALGVLVAAAILGIAVALPAWLAALIVAAALLVVAAALVFIGVAQLKRGASPVPADTIKSVKRDVRVIKGTVKRGRS